MTTLAWLLANSLAAIEAGVRQIECTINGIGERAGNASLEELVVALHVRQNHYHVDTNSSSKNSTRPAACCRPITGISVPPNKAVVGANAFAHEAGIHQDGILKNPLTYEIIVPEKVGVPARRLVLGKHSGRNAFRSRLSELGYEITDAEIGDFYKHGNGSCRFRKGNHRPRSDHHDSQGPSQPGTCSIEFRSGHGRRPIVRSITPITMTPEKILP